MWLNILFLQRYKYKSELILQCTIHLTTNKEHAIYLLKVRQNRFILLNMLISVEY